MGSIEEYDFNAKGEMMSLYKYVSSEDLLRVLDGNIRFTQPGAFNDPFEMVPELYVPENYGAKEISIDFSLTATRRQPSVGELEVDFESDYCNDINSRKIRSSLDQAIGILCLSRNGSSMLMWSYYAESYSGAIIEVDESHEFFTGIIDVQYRRNRPKIDIKKYFENKSPVPIAELCVKPKEWEYEVEVRIIRNLLDCKSVGESQGYPVYVMDFPIDCIKSVVLGERMSVDIQRNVYKKIKETKISLYLDAISNWGYEFRKEPIKINGLHNPIISPRTAHIFSHLEGTLGDAARWQIKNNKFSEMVNDKL